LCEYKSFEVVVYELIALLLEVLFLGGGAGLGPAEVLDELEQVSS